MKNKIPPFEELIDRLAVCIQKRNPEKDVGETAKGILAVKWKHKPKQLYTMVKSLEIQEFRHQDELENKRPEKELRIVEFQIGNDCIGNPIICRHIVLFENEYLSNNKKSSNYRKLKNPNKYFWQQEIFKQW